LSSTLGAVTGALDSTLSTVMHSGVTGEGIQSAGAGAISGIQNAVAGAVSVASTLAQQSTLEASHKTTGGGEYDVNEMAF
jgi:hypothetical protein